MASGDVESIGKHCQLEYCHVLDFLPFSCDSCSKYVRVKPLSKHALMVTDITVSIIAQSTHTNAPTQAKLQ
jgi:hypothetical protein